MGLTEDWVVDTAHLTHGQDGWRVEVERVSLWRLVASKVAVEVTHGAGFCCGWAARLPYVLYAPLHALVQHAHAIDNGWHHRQYGFDVDDDWAKAHRPDFWESVQDWDDEDEGGSEA